MKKYIVFFDNKEPERQIAYRVFIDRGRCLIFYDKECDMIYAYNRKQWGSFAFVGDMA